MQDKSFFDEILGDKIFLFSFLLLAILGLFVQFSAGAQTVVSIESQGIKVLVALVAYSLISTFIFSAIIETIFKFNFVKKNL